MLGSGSELSVGGSAWPSIGNFAQCRHNVNDKVSVAMVTQDSDSRGTGSPLHASLLSTIESGTVRVGIIGLGYVGLPLVRAFAERGIAVLGFDVDPVKVAKLEKGQSYIGHIPDSTIRLI